MEWQENVSRLHTFIKDVSSTPLEISSPRPAWVRLNCLQTGIGLFCLEMHKWSMASTAVSKCGTKEQTAEHIITYCHIYHHPNGAPCSLRCQQEPDDLDDGNMSNHLVGPPSSSPSLRNKELYNQ